MRTLRELSKLPVGISLLADDITEFHAARIILLISLCGTSGRIDGLTKLAKLDFFVRYPIFFMKATATTGEIMKSAIHSTESKMVRHHYGPWDHRYYDVLAYLRSRGLIEIVKDGNSFKFNLTSLGKETASKLKSIPEYTKLGDQMIQVKKAFGSKSGSVLKNLIYKIFEEEVAQKSLGEVI